MNNYLFSLVTLLFLVPYSVLPQSFELDKNASVSILTCSTGAELYATFGHTAVRIQDNSKGFDMVYNYGMFDFSTPNFYTKFVKGNLQYYVARHPFNDFLNAYIYDNRSVWEQKLNLNTAEKQILFDRLNQSLFSDERYYTYKFIDKNCTTMVAKQLEASIPGIQIRKVEDTLSSYRKTLNRYLTNNYFERLGINILFGYEADKKAEKLFLPYELKTSLEQIRYNEKPLVHSTRALFLQNENIVSFPWWNTVFTLIIPLFILLWIKNTRIKLIVISLLGIFGIFLIGVSFFSDHKELAINFNALLFNPLFLFYFILFNRKNTTVFLWITRIIYASLIFYILFTFNKAIFLTILPVTLFTIALLYQLQRTYYKNLYK